MGSGNTKARVGKPLVEDVVNRLRQRLEELGYSPSTLRGYRSVWRAMIEFAKGESYSGEFMQRFLRSKGICENEPEDFSIYTPNRPCVLAASHILIRFATDGDIGPHPYQLPKGAVPVGCEDVLESYKRYCERYRGCRPPTVRRQLDHAQRFLRFIVPNRRARIEDLQATDVSEFIKSLRGLSPRSLYGFAHNLKVFLRYLWAFGVVPEDISPALPKIRIPKDAGIPQVLAANDIRSILSAVERKSAKGERDYAILLLAYRLGLRSCEIRRLTLDDLYWAESRIEIRQTKTDSLLTLPIPEDVGEALIDYLRNGRPKTEYREVFLREHSPIAPIQGSAALACMFHEYRKKAGVGLPREGHAGMHSFRHAMASRMLENGVRLETISSVLGHWSLESTRIYTKVGLGALRLVALNPDALGSKEVHHE